MDGTSHVETTASSRNPSVQETDRQPRFSTSPGQPWHHDSRFHRYWKHYSDVRAWYFTHWFPTLGMIQQPFHPSAVTSPMNCYYDNPLARGENYDSESFYQYQDYYRHVDHSRGRYGHNMQMMGEDRNHSDDNDDEEDEEMDCYDNQLISDSSDAEDGQVVEVSQQMKEFFALSEKHREERRKEIENLKQKIFAGTEHDYINAEDIYKASASTSHHAPSEKPGERRRQEMKVLYGKDAAMIHGMETALQLQFDRNYDKKQPKLWPTIPIKL